MPKAEKVFTSITDQLKLLQQRGLIIDDPVFAEESLIRTSYYEIINGYKDLFIEVDQKEEQFLSGTTFSELYYLYEFDNALRFEMLAATLSAENLLRSVIAYVLAEEHRHKRDTYQQKHNYNQGKKIMHGRFKGYYERELLLQFFDEVYQSSHQPMKYYRENYRDLPPWILVKGLSFGNLQYLFKLMLPSSKTKIIARATGLNPELITEQTKQSFAEIFDILVAYRNWAAHGGRVYNHRVKKKLTFGPTHAAFNLSRSAYQKHRYGQSDILSFIIALTQLRDRTITERFTQSITKEMVDYLIRFPQHQSSLLEQMNIPTSLFQELRHRS